MESFESQIWIVCSEITTTAFWQGKTTFSIPNGPQGAEKPLGLCLGPGLQGREVIQTQEYSSLKMRVGETFFWSVQSGLRGSKAKLSRPWEISFFPYRSWDALRHSLTSRAWVLGFFLSCAVSAQTKIPERTCIYSLLSVETVNECTIHQGRSKGSWSPNLSDSSLKKKNQNPPSWPQEALKEENHQHKIQHGLKQISALCHQGSQELV